MMIHFQASPSSALSHHALPSPPLRLSAGICPDLRSTENDPRPPRIPNGSQVLVTRDSDAAYFVDLSHSSSPAAIKERIYAKLGIYDDEHANCRISRCRAGQPVGLPLDDWQLWDLCMRSHQDSDPPMLIVISTPQSATGPLSAHSAHSTSQPLFASLRAINSPHSPESSNQPRYDTHAPPNGRDSPDPNNLRCARSRWQQSNARPDQIPRSPHARHSTSSNPHSPSSQPLVNNHSLAPSSHLPLHAHPHSPGLVDERRTPTIGSNTPFEIPGYLLPHHPKHSTDPPDEWAGHSNPSTPSRQDEYTRPPLRPGRRTSDAPSPNALSSSQQASGDYARPARPLVPSSMSHTHHASRPAPNPSSTRRDLQTAKSMEDLRMHGHHEPPRWALPGASHPPLPAGGRLPASTAGVSSRAPAPLRIPRSNHPTGHELGGQRSLQQLSSNSSRTNQHPASLTPNMQFPQPAPTRGRPPGAPGYGVRPNSSSGATGSYIRSELRGQPASSRQQPVSSFVPQPPKPPSRIVSGPLPTEARHFDQTGRSPQWPPEPSPSRAAHPSGQ